MKLTSLLSILIIAATGQGLAHAGPQNYAIDLPDEFLDGVPESRAYIAPGGLSWSDYFSSHKELKSMRLGIQLGGVNPLSLSSSLPMLPASTEKLLTAGAALKYLGSQFRFQNSFHADLDSSHARLSGVHFKVSGDPTWAQEEYVGFDPAHDNQVFEPRLNQLLNSMVSMGIKEVVGPIKVESLHPELDQLPRSAGWKASWNLECMAMMQTSFQANSNCGMVQISSAIKGKWITRGVAVPLLLKLRRSRVGRTSIQVKPHFDSSGRIRSYEFTGLIGNTPVYYALPVHSGSEWLSNLFRLMLKDRGITYLEVVAGPTPPTGSLVAYDVDLSSDILLRVLATAVQKSINGVMDRIFAELAFQMGKSAEDVLRDYLQSLIQDGALMQGIQIKDGCGLDIRDRMRADTLYDFLLKVESEPYFQEFFSTLAVAGQSGTLQRRTTLVGSPYTNLKIFAKTGTLTGVNNLAGYFQIQGQRIKPFVVYTDSALSATQARVNLDQIVVNFAAQNTPQNPRF
jgi:D-alanyl-D-alanine carboxypeptidase/D-alanyl-D-alanine-endopeptidase (penicillin-binding protein 4)